jgi:acetoin utilization deacetylase AcuC-like enzyme
LHHGDGTEKMFVDDPHVLYTSIHRYDHGNFFPCTGDHTDCGRDAGKGFTVNVPLNVTELGDHEYLSIFHKLLLPILDEFQPTIVL